ncbi:MAG TPA: serine/threonine-protein kinase [Polyangiaceae bacterium]|nr:serine/threonine-protein kinase [Polyangiaceae bacterium]
MSSSSAWGPGYVIAQKFKLVRRLGQGGMGSVWAADHLALNSQVAVKIIDPAIASNAEALARFLREAQSAAALRSPHVVQTFDYGVEDGVPYIAMELLEGQSLAQRLEAVGRLSLEDTARILTDVGRAISRAHDAGIVHRDLKPDNIFLVQNDDEEIAKVLDFGIAKATGNALGNSSQTRTGAILGTPYYMSPEQAEGNRSVDHRTDLWSLAIIAFECVVGQRPFSSEALGDLILQICVRPIRKPSSVLPTVSKSFDEWYEKATQRDPAQRFQSARDLTTGLRAAAGLRVGSEKTAGLQSYADVRAQAPFQNTPAGALAGSGERVLNQTAGGVANTSGGVSSMPTPVIVGATLGALALAGTVGFFVLRGHGDAPGAAQSAAPSEHPAAAAPAEPVAPKANLAEPAKTAPPPTPAPEPAVLPTEPKAAEPPAATAAPAPAKAAATPLSATPKIAAKAAPAKPPAPAAKPPAKTTSKKVDFGF